MGILLHDFELRKHAPLHHFKQIVRLIAPVGGQVFDRNLRGFLPEEEIELLFVPEIVEQKRLADPGVLGDFPDRAFFVAIFRKDPEARIDDPLLLLFWQLINFSFTVPPPSLSVAVNFYYTPLTDFEKPPM